MSMDEGSRAARSWWPPVPRTLVMVGLVLALLVIHFTLLRACLMLRNSQSAADTSAGDLFWSFVAGLRFDAATASYLLAPFLLLGLAPRIGLADSRLHRRIFMGIFTLLVSVLTLVLLAEFEFFREFDAL